MLAIGLNLLNKYYSLTDNSDVYRIAIGMVSLTDDMHVLISSFLVLHPRYKLCYFEKLEWEPEWIKTAEDIVRDEFKHTYSEYVIPRMADPSRSSTNKVSTDISQFLLYQLTNLFP